MMFVRPEVLIVVNEITHRLNKFNILYSLEHSNDESNPNSFIIIAHDEHDYLNSAVIDWSEKMNRVYILAHDPARENHDVQEGVPVEDSKCWWECPDVEMLMLHLDGSVRQIMKKDRAIKYKKALDKEV